jgi:hypothetical protein
MTRLRIILKFPLRGSLILRAKETSKRYPQSVGKIKIPEKLKIQPWSSRKKRISLLHRNIPCKKPNHFRKIKNP